MMNKKDLEILKNNVIYDAYGNDDLPRYYIVDRIRYDFEGGGWYSVLELEKTKELRKYGTLSGAQKYAVFLYNKYCKELGSDLDVRIREEFIEINTCEKKLTKLENEITNLKNSNYTIKSHNDFLNNQCKKLIKENKELNNKLEESKKKYENRKQFCISETRSQTELINCLLEENQQLKHQLHDLPKKIVEEIIKELKTLYKNDPIIYTENKDIVKGCYDKDGVNKILDTILKKYGGENE